MQSTPLRYLRADFDDLEEYAPVKPLDVLAAEMSNIVGWHAPEGRFDGPALFLTGAESHYVKPEYRPAILSQFPAARFAKLPGAGHWLHADKPREFEETLRVFLSA